MSKHVPEFLVSFIEGILIAQSLQKTKYLAHSALLGSESSGNEGLKSKHNDLPHPFPFKRVTKKTKRSVLFSSPGGEHNTLKMLIYTHTNILKN